VVDDGVLATYTADRLADVLRPKVTAAWQLHKATEHLDLAAFVLYSSAAGTFGTAGQGAYAAANAYLDALAAHRRATGLPALSVAWGLWADTSELTATLDDTDHARLARTGILPMPADQAHAALDAALNGPHATVVAASLNLPALRVHAGSGLLPPVLRTLVPDTRSGASGADPAALTQRLAGLTTEEQHRVLLDLVLAQTATVLGHATAAAVDADRSFTDHGFDSLTAVELRNRLGAATGLRLPTTLVFDHPNVTAVARHLHDELCANGTTGDEAAVRALLASIPLRRLEENGLIERLLRLARDEPREAGPDRAQEIETADVEDLIQIALAGSASGSDNGADR
jgi:acyl carrier protein